MTIRIRLENATVRMAFEDNSVGILPANLDKLYAPYSSSRIGKGGTGLGMAVVHNLVTKILCGATLVTSALGQDTRVEIELP